MRANAKNFSGIELRSVDLDSISVEQGFLTYFVLFTRCRKNEV